MGIRDQFQCFPTISNEPLGCEGRKGEEYIEVRIIALSVVLKLGFMDYKYIPTIVIENASGIYI